MVRQSKPKAIANLDHFAADLEDMAKRLNFWSMSIHTASPQYWPIVDLQLKVIATIKTVAGREPHWMQPLTPPYRPAPAVPLAAKPMDDQTPAE